MNIIAVLGFTLLIHPIYVEFTEVIIPSIFMMGITLVLFFILKFRGGITKYYAGLLLLIYIIFLYFNFQNGVAIEI